MQHWWYQMLFQIKLIKVQGSMVDHGIFKGWSAAFDFSTKIG